MIMAYHDFWTNVRIGAKLYAPPFIAEAPRLDADAIERMLRQTTHWLTPRSVAGFDEEELSFLPDGERSQLAKLVADFRQETSTVSPMAPPRDDIVERALPLFRDIVRLLEFDRYEDAEAFRLGKLIEREIAPWRPPELAELRFRTGLDHTGDPGLWIWAFLSDEVSVEDEDFLEAARTLRGPLEDVARQVAPDRFPYLSFRSLMEQSEPLEAS
jgi:hypothetical protein